MARRGRTLLDIVSAETRPAVYLRVSTDEQADSGLGLASQLARARAMCEVKGWPDPVVYRDEGLSGTLAREDRPAFDMLLTAVESGAINAVIVLDLTRLARRASIIHSTLDLLSKYGAQFVSCKENFDTSTPMGAAMIGIMAVFAQLERDLISERTTAALAERKKAHGYASGPIPHGYTRAPGDERIGVDELAAREVRRVHELRQVERLTLRQIAARMGAATGRKWNPQTVKNILDDPRYGGTVEHWPRIV